MIKDIGEVLGFAISGYHKKVIEERRSIKLNQAVDSISKSTRFNLARDATFSKVHHINDVHVWKDAGPCILNVRPIEGGTADDYLIHIKNILVDAANLLAYANGIVAEEVMSQIKNRILSIISNRAVVNEAVSKRIGDWVDHDV